MSSSISSKKPFNIYVDGIFDIPHDGHLAMMIKAYNKGKVENTNAHLIVGVCDEGVKEYKRAPIMSVQERAASIVKLVGDKFPCTVLSEGVPISINKPFIAKYQIDMVVRGDDFSPQKLKEFYADAMEVAQFVTVPYTQGVSTSQILTSAKIKGTLGLKNVSHLTVSQDELVRRVQALSWKTLCINPPKTHRELTLRDRVSKVDLKVLKENNRFARSIERSGKAIWSSYYCLKSCVMHTTALAVDLCYRIVQSIRERRYAFDNFQLIGSRIAEIIKDLAGTFLATPLALFSPKRAAEIFLAKTDDFLVRALSPAEAADLYAIGKLVTVFLDRHQIEYRMASGTFLGAIRHKGIIPWDDDIDLMLAPEEKATLGALIADGTFSRETGLKIEWQEYTGGWEAFFPDGKVGPPILGKTLCPFIDLFCTVRTEDSRICFELPLQRNLAPNEFFTQEEWNTKVPYTFGPLVLWGPDEPQNYFNRAFGAAAIDIAYQTIHHVDFRVKKWPQRVVVKTDQSIEYDHARYEQRISR
jgi:cytidyltransferase-like protein